MSTRGFLDLSRCFMEWPTTPTRITPKMCHYYMGRGTAHNITQPFNSRCHQFPRVITDHLRLRVTPLVDKKIGKKLLKPTYFLWKNREKQLKVKYAFGLSPLPVTVTTRIITFLVGDPYKPSFATGILGGGTTQNMPKKEFQTSINRAVLFRWFGRMGWILPRSHLPSNITFYPP